MGGFPQGTGIRPWICQTWGPLTSSTSKRRRGRQMKKQNRSCACWRRMMWLSGVNPPAVQKMQETQVRSLGHEDPLEKETATHSSIVAWKIPWTEDSGGLQSDTTKWLGKVDCPPVKEEPRDEDEETKMKAPLSAARKIPGLPKDVSVAELLRELSLTQEEELLFLQLPDSLPGQPPTQDIKPVKTEVQSEDGQMVVIKQEKDREARLAENTCTLADLTEGQVGKLLIRKSGKVQLLLGKVTLDVTMGTTCSFLQELVSVGLGDSRTGDMTVLGHIKHKLVCSPNFESLLDHKHR
uniref:RNA polymerase III subunit D n=1 Tax=Ovis aries TaxID=9940 RepID=A0AC11E186_SHEEP